MSCKGVDERRWAVLREDEGRCHMFPDRTLFVRHGCYYVLVLYSYARDLQNIR